MVGQPLLGALGLSPVALCKGQFSSRRLPSKLWNGTGQAAFIFQEAQLLDLMYS